MTLSRKESLAKYGDVVDRWHALKNPGQWRRLTEAAAQAVQTVDLEVLEDHIDRGMADWYDSFIPDDAPFRGEDVRRGVKYRLNLDGAGKSRTDHQRRNMDIALRAFIRVEQNGGDTAAAMRHAMDELSKVAHGSSEKTVRQWLEAILPWSAIRRSPRGRPKK